LNVSDMIQSVAVDISQGNVRVVGS